MGFRSLLTTALVCIYSNRFSVMVNLKRERFKRWPILSTRFTGMVSYRGFQEDEIWKEFKLAKKRISFHAYYKR